MRTGSKIRQFILASALFGTLLSYSPVMAMDSDSMKMEGRKGEMMQSEQMSADEMIKKGNEMMTQGKEMKEKGMMMMMMMMKKKEMKKDGIMKEDKMMKENGMK